MLRISLAVATCLGMAWPLSADEPAVAEPPRGEAAVRPSIQGEIKFEAPPDEHLRPEIFRLESQTFAFQQTPLVAGLGVVDIFELRFASPVVTAELANNTVHCEYFRPVAAGRKPAVIVLHILGGDFALSQLFCQKLANAGVAALFLKMPYYGPRRTPGSSARMISDDPQTTVDGMRQAVLDIRRGAAWLAEQEEVDPKRLGVFGISLGGITAGLAGAVEPRFSRVCMMLAGGDLGTVSWDRPELSRIRDRWTAKGHTKEDFVKLLVQVDPVEYARPREDRKVLMLNAAHDEVIPRSCTESLWKAYGEPEIVWYDAGHYSAILQLPDGLRRVSEFFQAEADPPRAAE